MKKESKQSMDIKIRLLKQYKEIEKTLQGYERELIVLSQKHTMLGVSLDVLKESNPSKYILNYGNLSLIYDDDKHPTKVLTDLRIEISERLKTVAKIYDTEKKNFMEIKNKLRGLSDNKGFRDVDQRRKDLYKDAETELNNDIKTIEKESVK